MSRYALSTMRAWLYGALLALAMWIAWAGLGRAQTQGLMAGVVEFDFTPVHAAQLALWIEKPNGDFVSTVRLTEAVATRGIGNRPGASEMNSGFRWPYGRREGVLPIWATRRAAAPDAKQWKRVIFQNRTTEGLASRTSNDMSVDNYYCLSFNRARSTKDALDAMSCATVFSSDKGRFITAADVAAGYSEPYEVPSTHDAVMRPLSQYSLYPPRRDVSPCSGTTNCYDHADVGKFASHAREVMPEIDAVTMATPEGGKPQQILFMVPSDWEPGDYRACIEVNVEGDYNDTYNDKTYPTPTGPNGKWDSWAMQFGYPYRGQPSVVYCADIAIGGHNDQTFFASDAAGTPGTWDVGDPSFGKLQPMVGMTDDPVHSPGSGADRLELMGNGYRFKVVVRPALSCMDDAPPSAVQGLTLANSSKPLHSHEWAHLEFRAASDDHGIFRYEVRVSEKPITDDVTFTAAMPAKQATTEAAELVVPVDAKPGETVAADFGGLLAETHYYVAVRAMDACTSEGPISSGEVTTTRRKFATVSPCFVATAAYGSPLAQEVGSLRRFRDRELRSTAVGRALVAGYYAVGPTFADAIRGRDRLRALARAALEPVIAVAHWLDD